MGKLDPELERLLDLRTHGQSISSRASAESGAADAAELSPPTVRVLVQFDGDLEVIRTAGLMVTVVVGPVAGGEIELDRLPAMAALPQVLRVEVARPMQPELNVSVPEIRADLVHRPSPLGLRGSGVIVGILEPGGVDFRHGTFIRADGKTRILRIWDQTLTPVAGESSPATTNRGVEYTDQQIDAVLAYERLSEDDRNKMAAPLAVRHKDEGSHGHGTHVAGIAAGNGAAPGGCFTYVGVAPEADLIVVTFKMKYILRRGRFIEPSFANSLDVLEGINYVFSAAGSLTPPRPAVINLSSGDNLGAHDGSGLLETALENYRDEPGRVVVKSAGNEGESGAHAQGIVTAGATESVRFEVPIGEPSGPFDLEIWYDVRDSFSVTVTNTANETSAPPVAAGGQQIYDFPDGNTVDIRSIWGSPLSDNRISIELRNGTRRGVRSGVWTLGIIGSSVVNGQFHCWIEKNVNQPAFQPPHRSDTHTITAPGTSTGVITVGSYITWGLFTGLPGGRASSSGQGPTRDGRVKPDVAAPGQWITSALPTDRCNCFVCCQGQHHELAGTSMAAPHVAGVVALMLQKNPTLTMTQVLAHLTATCRKDSFTGPLPTPDNLWGAGKITAFGAVTRVKPVTPPGPPTQPPGSGGGFPGAAGPAFFGPLVHGRMRGLSPTAELVVALVSKHFSEVRGLLNSNLRVAAPWHRMHGPQLFHSLVQAVSGGHVLSTALDLDTVAARIPAFIAALASFGSPALRSDLERYRSTILAAADRENLTSLLAADAEWLRPVA